jgi:hypothetical protein
VTVTGGLQGQMAGAKEAAQHARTRHAGHAEASEWVEKLLRRLQWLVVSQPQSVHCMREPPRR